MMSITENNNVSQEIFKDNAWKLFERNFNPLPIVEKQKYPIIKEWQNYGINRLNEETLDLWEEKYPRCNIGIATGKASGIIAVDFDGLEETEFSKLIPRSIVERKGKKGWVRFFKFSGEENRKFRNLNIEIFSTSTQVLIPPSIHPDTLKPYQWTSLKTIYDIDRSDLNPLPKAIINLLSKGDTEEKTQKESNTGEARKHSEGRNNAIYDLVSKLVNDNVSRELIMEQVIEYDEKYHNPAWMTDKTESMHRGDFDKAKTFVEKMIDSAAKKDGNYLEGRMVLNIENFKPKEIEPETISEEEETDGSEIMKQNFPQIPYFMEEIVKMLQGSVHVKIDKFNLAPILALTATVMSNKVKLKGMAPNLYAIIVTGSGNGKDAYLKFPQKTLGRLKARKYIGFSEYRSDKAMQKPLTRQQERIDTLDEVSSLFKSMNSKNATHLSAIGERLSSIWSSSTTFWGGLTNSEDTTGMCFNPCINIISATTPEAFSRTFALDNLDQGIGGRFMYFYEPNQGILIEEPGQFAISDDVKNPYIESWFKFWESTEVVKKVERLDEISGVMNEGGDKKDNDKTMKELKETEFETTINKSAISLEIEKDAWELLKKFKRYWFYNKANKPASLQPVINRLYETAIKASICHYSWRVFDIALKLAEKGALSLEVISPNSIIAKNPISLDDAKWGKAVAKACLYNAAQLFDENIFESKLHRDGSKIMKSLNNRGGKLTWYQLCFNLRRKKQPFEIKKSLEHLVKMSEVFVLQKIAGPGKKGFVVLTKNHVAKFKDKYNEKHYIACSVKDLNQ